MRTRVVISIPYLGVGGAERMVSLLGSSIDQERFDVRVLCIYGDFLHNMMENELTCAGVRIDYLHKGLGLSPKAIFNVAKYMNDFKPDIIHTHLASVFYCLPWAWLHGRKVIHTIHNTPEKEFRSPLREKIMRALYRTGAVIPVAISEMNRRLSAEFYGLPACRIEMVVNPVKIDSGPAAPADADTKYDFISVGRLVEQKNPMMLLRAMRTVCNRHPETSLAIVGDGPMMVELRGLCSELGLDDNVTFLGVRDDVCLLLAQSSIFVSSSDYEGLPMTMLEAMAACRPLVGTDVGGVVDIIHDKENGIVVPKGDVYALAEAMTYLYENPEVARVMGKAGRMIALPYSTSNVAEQYEFLYNKYAKRPQK